MADVAVFVIAVLGLCSMVFFTALSVFSDRHLRRDYDAVSNQLERALAGWEQANKVTREWQSIADDWKSIALAPTAPSGEPRE